MKTYLFPGQGSQRVGMGENLFDAFPDITETADAILGLSIRELCLQDPQARLNRTQYTQPALYVVNALAWRQHMKETGERPDFVAGHSLGEYNALECAGAIRFDDGLRLVSKRGELMSAAPKGAMAAVIGLTIDRVGEILAENELTVIDIANHNAPTQVIVSGLEADIASAQTVFEAQQAMYIPLNVSGAFHSRYMRPVVAEFEAFLQDFDFASPEIPVIANVSGLPYPSGEVARNLADQITHSVRWLDGMHYLLRQGAEDFVELGPGDVLTKLIKSIRSRFEPAADGQTGRSAPAPTPASTPASTPALAPVPPTGAEPASTPRPAEEDPQQRVTDWNRSHPVGTRVRAKGYDRALTTRTQAVVLFGHRAAVYMDGYNGYFALDEVEPVEHADSPA